ncbi:nicotinamide mononucleotide deamidase-related protein [Tardisphaera miroshnichenkoae]
MSALENSKAIKAEILTIGNEVLTGRVVNTNAAYIARRLSLVGVSVKRITVVADNEEEIVAAVRESLSRKPEYVITTGGLGPTYDDISMAAIAKAVGLPLKRSELALSWIEQKIRSENAPLTPEREKMAYLPNPSKELDNPVGVAPGAWIEAGDDDHKTAIIVLPGVPSEMESMLEKHLMPVLVREQRLFVAEREVRITGIFEASLAPYIKKLVRADSALYVKTHPGGTVDRPSMLVHVEYASPDRQEAERKAEEAIKAVKEEAQRLGATIS